MHLHWTSSFLFPAYPSVFTCIHFLIAQCSCSGKLGLCRQLETLLSSGLSSQPQCKARGWIERNHEHCSWCPAAGDAFEERPTTRFSSRWPADSPNCEKCFYCLQHSGLENLLLLDCWCEVPPQILPLICIGGAWEPHKPCNQRSSWAVFHAAAHEVIACACIVSFYRSGLMPWPFSFQLIGAAWCTWLTFSITLQLKSLPGF